jgi:transposase
MEQQLFVGLDVSQKLTHICVVDAAGKVAWQGKCLSVPETVAGVIREKAPDAVKIGFESGPLATWFWHALRDLGLPVICLDARHAKQALKMQVNKTDKNDAHGLAQIVRTGWYREVGVKSIASHLIRSVLGARAQLVGMRTETINQIRGILKTFGIVLPGAGGQVFERKVQELANGQGMLANTLRALLEVYNNLKEQIDVFDRHINSYARHNPVCHQLMTIPGVGRLTAVAFVTAIDDPAKFQKSRNVGAFFGLTPKTEQSGDSNIKKRISKWGDALVRCYLYEAANVLLTRVEKWSALKAWGLRIAKRSGMNKARVAVARKLAIIMHRMWLTGEEFRWSVEQQVAA